MAVKQQGYKFVGVHQLTKKDIDEYLSGATPERKTLRFCIDIEHHMLILLKTDENNLNNPKKNIDHVIGATLWLQEEYTEDLKKTKQEYFTPSEVHKRMVNHVIGGAIFAFPNKCGLLIGGTSSEHELALGTTDEGGSYHHSSDSKNKAMVLAEKAFGNFFIFTEKRIV